jgi:hypothetical protein
LKSIGQPFSGNELKAFREKQIEEEARLEYAKGEVSIDTSA